MAIKNMKYKLDKNILKLKLYTLNSSSNNTSQDIRHELIIILFAGMFEEKEGMLKKYQLKKRFIKQPFFEL